MDDETMVCKQMFAACFSLSHVLISGACTWIAALEFAKGYGEAFL